MAFEGGPGALDPRKAWKERDSERRAKEHVARHPIPGMQKWIDTMRGKGSADKAPDAGHEGTGK